MREGPKNALLDGTRYEYDPILKRTYDQMGRQTQVQKVIGATFPINYQYNAAGEVTQVKYPSGRTVVYGYDAVGKLLSVADGATTYLSIPLAIGYNDAAQPITLNYGNGVVGSFAYSVARSQLTSLSYKKGTQTYFSLNYWYAQDPSNCLNGIAGNDGQIQCITDAVDSGRTMNFTYDFLDRIGSAVTNGSIGYAKWGLSWTYDRYGNRWSQNQTSGSPPANSLSFASGAYTNRPDNMCFDASGNLLTETPVSPCPPAAPTYIYDAENRLVGYQTAVYTYDGKGLRVKKMASGTTTVYLFSGQKDIAEYDNGAAPGSPSREYIYSGSQLVAAITGGATPTTVYHHADHLSVRLSTDSAGNKVGEQGHYPFGEPWYTANTTSKFIFTSYERDSESGNDFAMARFYINRFGRFCSADPILGSADDPQTWNRYAYVQNNPVNLTDPSGKSFWSFLDKFFRVLFFLLGGGIGDLRHLAGGGIGLGTPPTFPGDPSDNTNILLRGIYHAIGQSRFLIIQNFQLNPSAALQNDCLKFASMTEQIAKAAKTAEEFMDKMASTFTSANNSGIVEMYNGAYRRMPAGRPTFGDSGFKPQFRDGSNQVRHFVGGLVAGYRLGSAPADILMDQREDPGNPDTRLNAVSTKLGGEGIVKETWTRPGRGIAQVHIENKFGTLADEIRKQVCD